LFFVTVALSPISVNRANTLRGREAIAAFFAQKRNIRLPQGCVLRVAFLVQTSEHRGLKFMIVVSKRIAKRAHDRNQIKRWVKAAIGQIPAFAELDEQARESGKELILLLSAVGPPSKDVNWKTILGSVEAIPSKISIQNSEFRIPTAETAP
jgi:ribonuclease P protein component